MNRFPALCRSNPRYLNQSVIRRLNTIALRREDKSRWERRVALTPDDVSKLIKETGVKVYVQPCNKRIFSNEKYEQVCNKFILTGTCNRTTGIVTSCDRGNMMISITYTLIKIFKFF